ncbi:MAG: hypothetical protein R3B93_12540 [Bacteroidia bacterium]
MTSAEDFEINVSVVPTDLDGVFQINVPYFDKWELLDIQGKSST